jgi:hypothetical protein
MLNRRLNARTHRDIAELARFTTRNSNPELDYDGVGSELAGTAPPSLSQSRTLRRPPCHPRVERNVALRTQTRTVLVELVESLSNHGASDLSSERRVSGAGATYITITWVPEFLDEIAKSKLASQSTGQRMLRPNCSTIRTYACKAAEVFSLLHATQPSVATVGLSGRNTTLSCSSFFNCSGTRATPNPAATA